jgi:hypothetical protein
MRWSLLLQGTASSSQVITLIWRMVFFLRLCCSLEVVSEPCHKDFYQDLLISLVFLGIPGDCRRKWLRAKET